MSNNLLADTLPWWLATVGRLEVLNLRNNRLRGKLPSEWGTIFAAFAGVERKLEGSAVHAMTETLQTLDLGANVLTGGIPSSFGNFVGMKSLLLDSNRFSGAVPEELTRLRALRKITLNVNQFFSIPNFTKIDRLDTVWIENNALEFGPLEPNLEMVKTSRMRYAPQAEVGLARRVTVVIDSALTLTQRVSGTNNRYEWRRADTAGKETSMGAPSAQSSTLVLASLKAGDAGVYRCYITNPDFPALTLVSRPVMIETRLPSRPPETPVLLNPEWQEEDIFVRPILEWQTVQGAAVYETEIATDSLFNKVVQRFMTQQSEQGLQAGKTRRQTVTLDALQRHYWRTRAENIAGKSDWSNWSVFVTAPSNVSFEVQRVNFGDVPRLDTAERTMIIRNISSSAAVLRSITLQRGITGQDISLTLPAPDTMVLPGDSVVLPASFAPQTLGPQTAKISITYSTAGTTDILRNEYGNKLVGRGAMLKIIVPNFDTVVVGKTRVATVLFINRGFTMAEIRSIRLTDQSRGEYSLVNGNGESVSAMSGLNLAVADTAVIGMRLMARTVGVLAPNSVRYVANVDSSEARLQAYARNLSANDVVVRMGIRAVPDSVAPGGETLVELYIASRTTGFGVVERVASLREMVSRAVPRISGSLTHHRQVMTLKNGNSVARRLRNSVGTRETIIIPTAGWDGIDTVILRMPFISLAGSIDTTVLRLEAIDWPGMVLDIPADGRFVAKPCLAGGKRLVTSAKPVSLSLAAPNPAKDVVQLGYTVREDGYVHLVIVDMHGKIVQILVAQDQGAGEYNLQATVKSLPSGAYTVHLQTGGTVKTQRLDVVR